ncbi:hypothetical protein PSSHI_12850 [Photobacterium sp. R1]
MEKIGGTGIRATTIQEEGNNVYPCLKAPTRTDNEPANRFMLITGLWFQSIMCFLLSSHFKATEKEEKDRRAVYGLSIDASGRSIDFS